MAVQVIQDARVRVVICRDDRFVIVCNVDGDHTWWSLPGGGLEIGETLGEAAVREVWEETGLEVRLIGVLHFAERKAAEGYNVGITFRAEVVGGREYKGNDPMGIVQEVRWVTLEEAQSLVRNSLRFARVALQQGQRLSGYSQVQG